jgi:hypothetical protein
MKNPLDYLWYKIYKLSFYTEGKATRTTSMGAVLFANLITVIMLIYGDISFFLIVFALVLSFFLTYPYEKYKKQAKIIRQYYNESKKSRIRGNIIVTIYIISSFVIVYLVAIYHITIQNIL